MRIKYCRNNLLFGLLLCWLVHLLFFHLDVSRDALWRRKLKHPPLLLPLRRLGLLLEQKDSLTILLYKIVRSILDLLDLNGTAFSCSSQ